MPLPDPHMNGRRLNESIQTMAAIGATAGGGVHRLALSPEDGRARDLLASWIAELGLELLVDEMGNMIAEYPGTSAMARPVMIGSHLDSQPFGGRFDGALGVLAGLEVLRTLREAGVKPRRSILLANWTNEEGARFQPSILGSGVWTGVYSLAFGHGRVDAEGVSVKKALRGIGYLGGAPCRSRPLYAYLELHVEQGPQLEATGNRIGAPRGIVALHHHEVEVLGEANQVGPTPMEGRRDALAAAAEMILAVRRLPSEMEDDMVATVGRIENRPNVHNVIPGRVLFSVDLRSFSDSRTNRAWDLLVERIQEIARRHGCQAKLTTRARVGRCVFDPRLVALVERTAQSLDLPVCPMVSGAGHDATHMGRVGPTAMIFVPSKGGRSHVECEDTSPEDCEAGANVLLRGALSLAQEGGEP